jgi:hypothetical protein
VVTRRQLLAAGVTRDVIDGRLRRSEFRALHVGVYQVGPIAGARAREVAAVLACGGVVSHRSTAVTRRLAPGLEGAIDIAIPPGRRNETVHSPLRAYTCCG